MTERTSERRSGEFDRTSLVAVLEEHPVCLAVLFGSTVRDERHPRSDLDVAVEFEPDCSDTLDTRLSLWADISSALDRNDVDLALVDDLDPRVGAQAFAEGELLVGSEDRFVRHRRRFERLAERDDRTSPADRFDEALERLDRVMEG